MSLIASILKVMAPPHPEARPFLLASGATTLVSRFLSRKISNRHLKTTAKLLGTTSALFFGFCLYFFRDPKRHTPARNDVAVAPADGRIVSIEKIAPPAELNMGTAPVWRIATFLSVLDVHVNRVPAAGTVTCIAYHPGQFLNASIDKASDLNERNAMSLRLPDGRMLAVVQIAGLIARRIVCSVSEGMQVEAGERFGLIRFGSRTDLYLPPGVEPLVSVGQTMIGGETVMARL